MRENENNIVVHKDDTFDGNFIWTHLFIGPDRVPELIQRSDFQFEDGDLTISTKEYVKGTRSAFTKEITATAHGLLGLLQVITSLPEQRSLANSNRHEKAFPHIELVDEEGPTYQVRNATIRFDLDE